MNNRYQSPLAGATLPAQVDRQLEWAHENGYDLRHLSVKPGYLWQVWYTSPEGDPRYVYGANDEYAARAYLLGVKDTLNRIANENLKKLQKNA